MLGITAPGTDIPHGRGRELPVPFAVLGDCPAIIAMASRKGNSIFHRLRLIFQAQGYRVESDLRDGKVN
jgi:hypothetical protein